ncbi:hypothetical protein DFH06DRAFT_1304363 [Mycena polygramma]|nr:hypothetical protein DFH06DRAFT_1304363 [Mycena polygramma]
MSTRQKRLKKPPACDNCKARRVLCHPQPDNAPCPRCVEKDAICTTTPVIRGRPKKPQTTPSKTPVAGGSSLALTCLAQSRSSNSLDISADCPPLDSEFVAHCFECFEFIPTASHPLIPPSGVKATAAAVAFQLDLLPPHTHALALCIVALAALVSPHPSIIGPGPRPQSLQDQVFFATHPDLSAFGVRRASAYRALRTKAMRAAWELGIMLEPTIESALACYLLDLLEESDACGLARPWAGAYVQHIRALAPSWRAGKYTESDESRWMGFLMSETLSSTNRRTPMLITLHDQIMLAGPEPPPLDALLASVESSKKPGLQVVWPSMNPFAFHVACLARQLSETINGDFARLRPLSESAALKFLNSLTLLHAFASFLLARISAAIGTSNATATSRPFDDASADGIARMCAYGLAVSFAALALPFYRELNLSLSCPSPSLFHPDPARPEPEPRVAERLRAVRRQARELALEAVRELARALRWLPRVHWMPKNWHVVGPLAEFCVEEGEGADGEVSREDFQTIAHELKLLGYALDALSTPQAVELE